MCYVYDQLVTDTNESNEIITDKITRQHLGLEILCVKRCIHKRSEYAKNILNLMSVYIWNGFDGRMESGEAQ